MADKNDLLPQEVAHLYLMIQEKGLDAVLDGVLDTIKDLKDRRHQNVIWMQPDNTDTLIDLLEVIVNQGE